MYFPGLYDLSRKQQEQTLIWMEEKKKEKRNGYNLKDLETMLIAAGQKAL